MTDNKQIPLGKQRSFASSPKVILSKQDLQLQTTSAIYEVTTALSVQRVTVDGMNRRVLETLRIGPIFAASPVRLSAAVCRLRKMGVDIETERLQTACWPEWAGAYFLNCSVEFISSEAI